LAGVALSLNASTGNAAIPLAVDSVYWCTNVASLLKLDTANAEGAVQQSLLETLEAVLAVREA
jgi:hypothetical protein